MITTVTTVIATNSA